MPDASRNLRRNFPAGVGSEDSLGAAVRLAPRLVFAPYPVAWYGGARARLLKSSVRPSLRKRRLVLRFPRGISQYLERPTIPNDYLSKTTIPKLNFRFP